MFESRSHQSCSGPHSVAREKGRVQRVALKTRPEDNTHGCDDRDALFHPDVHPCRGRCCWLQCLRCCRLVLLPQFNLVSISSIWRLAVVPSPPPASSRFSIRSWKSTKPLVAGDVRFDVPHLLAVRLEHMFHIREHASAGSPASLAFRSWPGARRAPPPGRLFGVFGAVPASSSSTGCRGAGRGTHDISFSVSCESSSLANGVRAGRAV